MGRPPPEGARVAYVLFLVETINRLQQLPEWRSMAVILAADDSDGCYDRVMPPIVNQSNTPLDFRCEPHGQAGRPLRLRVAAALLVISPYAKSNDVSHALTG
jgi:phospholipase C